MNRNRNFNR